jgi:site-specific DNA-methyltransferase (adenine-specific)
VYDREDALETYAYNFIHTDKPEKIFNMKFDVIVGNPPYQLSDAGHGRSASPIYHKFIEQAKKLNPRYLTMIIPARWYAGGKGLDDFRAEMLADKRIRKLVDFENSNDVFPGVDVAGGICYFLWDRDNKGQCEVINLIDGKQVKSERALDEFPILIRHSQAIPIIRKVLAKNENGGKRLSEVVSSRKPFGLPTNYKPKNSGVPCWFIQKIGLKYASKSDISDDNKLLDKWKLLVPPAPIAGQTDFSKPVGFYYDGNTRIAKPGECCTESFIVAGAFSTEKEVLSFKTYLFTKIVRFLLLQTVVSQHVTKDKFHFIPDLGKYQGEYTDRMLIERWGITDDEWNFIDSKIKNIGANETVEVDE